MENLACLSVDETNTMRPGPGASNSEQSAPDWRYLHRRKASGSRSGYFDCYVLAFDIKTWKTLWENMASHETAQGIPTTFSVGGDQNPSPCHRLQRRQPRAEADAMLRERFSGRRSVTGFTCSGCQSGQSSSGAPCEVRKAWHC